MEEGGGGRAAAAGVAVVDLCVLLPEGCIANVLSLTTPLDACRLSLVASSFRSAAESDAVWERFLPYDYKDIIARAESEDPPASPPLLFMTSSKKQLYLWLSDHPLIIDHGTKSFSLEKWSGRRCYMLAARGLAIVWGDTPTYWRWIYLPESRFSEVAELISVCWLEIRGEINTSMLSPNTNYAAYLVFKSTAVAYGFEYQPAEVGVGIKGGESESETRTVYLDPDRGGQRQRYHRIIIPRQIGGGGGLFNRNRSLLRRHAAAAASSIIPPRESDGQYPKVRGDGWMEIGLGEYFNKGSSGGGGEVLEMSLMEVRGGNWKSGLIVQGIEIRPKEEDGERINK